MPGDPINPPVVLSSTFAFGDTAESVAAAKGEGHLYSRWSNPTVEATEEAVARLAGAERALAFSSGMAAISNALLTALATTPRLLCHSDVYGGTIELVRDLLPRLGIEVRFFPTDDWQAALEASRGEAWGAVYVETPTNPTLRLLDLRALADATHNLGALLVVDNTFATPLGQRALELGADVEVHSATKGLAGHHDLLAGIVCGSASFCQQLWGTRKLLGAILDPHPAFLLHRGLKTLEVRLARQSETALALARWLDARDEIAAVHYPLLEHHPDHAIAKAQLACGGCMLSVEARGGFDAAVAIADGLSSVIRAPSLGGTESLVTLPKTTSHLNLTDDELEQAGIAPGLLRLSIGLEPLSELTADFERAFAAL